MAADDDGLIEVLVWDNGSAPRSQPGSTSCRSPRPRAGRPRPREPRVRAGQQPGLSRVRRRRRGLPQQRHHRPGRLARAAEGRPRRPGRARGPAAARLPHWCDPVRRSGVPRHRRAAAHLPAGLPGRGRGRGRRPDLPRPDRRGPRAALGGRGPLRGFDPLFTNGMEDVDLCRRLATMRQGRFLVRTGAPVVHHESRTPGRYDKHLANRALYLDRWGGAASPGTTSRCGPRAATASWTTRSHPARASPATSPSPSPCWSGSRAWSWTSVPPGCGGRSRTPHRRGGRRALG